MKAIVWTAYGSPAVLQLQEVEKPSPKDNEVLIKIESATVGAWDCEMRVLKFPLLLALALRLYAGVIRPSRLRILGQELAGEVAAAGKDVTRFKVGDQVFGATGFGMGAHAEYKCLAEDATLVIKPANLSAEQAAAVPVGGMEALHFLRLAHVQPGQTILINGAGGSIGTMAVQIAKHLGAEVTAVDSADKFEMLRAIGADHVIDYTTEDFTQSGTRYDLILDVVGKAPYSGSLRSLKEHGSLLIANPSMSDRLRGPWTAVRSGKKVITAAGGQTREELLFLKGLIEAGAIKPVIDRSYPLAETAAAHRYVESGVKKGSVAISVTPSESI